MTIVDDAELATEQLLALSSMRIDDRARADMVVALRGAIERARAEWPGVQLDARRFATHLAARIDGERPPAEAVAALDAAGLWLACACLDRDPLALQAFEDAFAAPLGRVFGGVIAAGADGDDLAQRLRTRVLLGTAGSEPALARYAGRGPLLGWLRVIAARMRIDAERGRIDAPLQDHGARELARVAEDPELAYLAAHCRVAFADAIRDAFAGLTPRQRNLLRLHLVRAVSIPGIAEVYAVHVSSVKRWLADARAELVARAEAELRRHLGADTRELHSVLRVVESRLELSLRALIEDTRAEPDAD